MWPIPFLTRFGRNVTVMKDGTKDSRKKALVALLMEVMSSRINKAVRELISFRTIHISHHTIQHIR